MLKILKHLKKSVIALFIVTLLLGLQAACDLALPTYTSDIINVGIAQGGIDDTIPEIIRKSELDKLLLFMKEEEQSVVLSHYVLLDRNNMSEQKWNSLLKSYPLLESEELYQWDNKEEALLKDYLSLPMMLTYGLTFDPSRAEEMRSQLVVSLPVEMVTQDMDVFDILFLLPQEAKANVVAASVEYAKEMPDLLLSQTATAYVKAEYETIGININSLQTRYIILVGAKMVGLAFAAMLTSVLVTLLASRIAAIMGKDLRKKVFEKVVSFSNKEMDQFSTASLITRSTNDIQQVQMLIVMMIRIVIYAPILAVGGIFRVLNTNASMTWILAAGVATIFSVIITLLIVTLPKFKLMQKLIDRVNLVMREIITGLPVIRAFSTQQHEEKRFDGANKDLTRNSLFVSRVMTFLFPALMLIMNLVSILILWVSADRINAGTMQVGDMVAFIQYTMQIIMSFLMLTMISIVLPRAAVAAKRIDEVLMTKNSIEDPDTTKQLDTKKKGLLEFNNVHFRYPNAEEDVLSGISFIAKPGETTAIIGSTGSGKSTLINLIPRFYDVTGGKITIDGVDIRNIKQRTLRDQLGFVPQKGVLFTGTIESNIKFSNSNASDADMKKAARIAQATEFIEAMPENYQSPIAQGGTNVSGGQKQRLAIARALAKDPEIYVFDDSFSALDYKTDATLRKTLKEELTDRTIIIVAQRISTIMNAEQILVLDEGRIVGKGTHKELLKSCDVYYQIASSQLSKEELAYE